MKCNNCLMYRCWNNESDSGEACAIFGDGWSSPFQHKDKDGAIVGCYLDRHFIEKTDAEMNECYAAMAESMGADAWDWAAATVKAPIGWMTGRNEK